MPNRTNPLPFDKDLLYAFNASSFPFNPLPFLDALSKGVKEFGTDWIKTDEAKALLFIVNAQAYGQLAEIDMHQEWNRLNGIKE